MTEFGLSVDGYSIRRDLYGTTEPGGAHNSLDAGTIFQLTPGEGSDRRL
jgi:uncharacterized repeat protein (TIGR03803 family)